MQLLVDFLPIIVFVVAYKMYGIYVATGAIMVAMLLQVLIQWLRHRKVSKLLLVSTGLIIVLGGITLALRNPIFVQWKPTIAYWVFALILFGSQFIGNKTPLERALGSEIALPRSMWRQLNTIWVVTFALLGLLNLYVVYRFDEDTWVNFKVFGILGITLVVFAGQIAWIAAHLKSAEQGKEN
jgi:intracellular septation protein